MGSAMTGARMRFEVALNLAEQASRDHHVVTMVGRDTRMGSDPVSYHYMRTVPEDRGRYTIVARFDDQGRRVDYMGPQGESDVGLLDLIARGEQPKVVHYGTHIPITAPEPTTVAPKVVNIAQTRAAVAAVREARALLETVVSDLRDADGEHSSLDMGTIIGNLEACMDDCAEALMDVEDE